MGMAVGKISRQEEKLSVIQGGKGNARAAENRDPLNELSFRKPIWMHVREFAAIIAAIALCVVAFKHYRGTLTLELSLYITTLALVFYLVGRIKPIILYPIWKGWMWLGHALGIIMSSIVLGVGWIILMIPVAVLLKILSKKVMDLSFKAPVETYWEERTDRSNDFKLLERQF